MSRLVVLNFLLIFMTATVSAQNTNSSTTPRVGVAEAGELVDDDDGIGHVVEERGLEPVGAELV